MKIKPPIEKLLESAAVHLHESLAFKLRDLTPMCGSPIEVVLLEAICLHHLIHYGAWPTFNDTSYEVPLDQWRVYLQHEISGYRADFLVTMGDLKKKLVVECDGHDFHERTKEQAARDRKRDRDMTLSGYCVIRFTGSEIWRDPWQCAEDIYYQIIAMWEEETLE